MSLQDLSKRSRLSREEKIDVNSPLQKMHTVHASLSQAVKEVDDIMAIAHCLHCTNRLSADETRSFTSAMAEMTHCVEEWKSFFNIAAGRPHPVQHENSLIDLEAASCSSSEDNNFLQDQDTAISCSPLVACSRQNIKLFTLSPLNWPQTASKQRLAAASVIRSMPVECKFDPGRIDVKHPQIAPAFPETQTLKLSQVDNLLTFAAHRPLPVSPNSPDSMELVSPQDFPAKHSSIQSLRKAGVEPNINLPIPIPKRSFVKSPPTTHRPPNFSENISFADPRQGALESNRIPKGLFGKSPPKTCKPLKVSEIISLANGDEPNTNPFSPILETRSFGNSPPKTFKPLKFSENISLAKAGGEPNTNLSSPILETPSIIPNSSSHILETPSFRKSPPKTSKPQKSSENISIVKGGIELDSNPLTPVLETPSSGKSPPMIRKPLKVSENIPLAKGRVELMTSSSSHIHQTPSFEKSPSKTCKPPKFTNHIPLAKVGAEPNTWTLSPILETSSFGSSPPETCTPLKSSQTYTSTPYSTPDSVLGPMPPFSISKSSLPLLVDHMSNSCIKRLGASGLKEDLWMKLKNWNIDTALTGDSYAKARLPSVRPLPNFGYNGKNKDLESKEDCENVSINCVTAPNQSGVSSMEEGFVVRQREFNRLPLGPQRSRN